MGVPVSLLSPGRGDSNQKFADRDLISIQGRVGFFGRGVQFKVSYAGLETFIANIRPENVVSVMKEIRTTWCSYLNAQSRQLDRGASFVDEIVAKAPGVQSVNIAVAYPNLQLVVVAQHVEDYPSAIRLTREQAIQLREELDWALAETSH